uniref:Uncharacterized protein n=1 Tax=Rhizophora mucronata TaxID=61149 RepID=A0A2P2QEH2_RHIMU
MFCSRKEFLLFQFSSHYLLHVFKDNLPTIYVI